ncbi:MAG: hypothetical protein H0U85_00915 [Gemmatimonadales bacterium]|nr:hypothetical protein [Gemmatimonadales bacterium]
MPDSNRNTLKGDHGQQDRQRPPLVDGAHGEQEDESSSADEARKEAEGTFGKTGKHDS